MTEPIATQIKLKNLLSELNDRFSDTDPQTAMSKLVLILHNNPLYRYHIGNDCFIRDRSFINLTMMDGEADSYEDNVNQYVPRTDAFFVIHHLYDKSHTEYQYLGYAIHPLELEDVIMATKIQLMMTVW